MSGYKPPMKKKPVIAPGTSKPAPVIQSLPPIVRQKPNPSQTIERKLPAKYLPPPNTSGGPTIGGDCRSYSAIFNYASIVPESININHNLNNDIESSLAIALKDDNGDNNYITSFDVVDKNNIKLYGLDKMDTKKFTITVFVDTSIPKVFNFE
jgi:hypothetical protein